MCQPGFAFKASTRLSSDTVRWRTSPSPLLRPSPRPFTPALSLRERGPRSPASTRSRRSGSRETEQRFSLSLRERAGVRGKSAHECTVSLQNRRAGLWGGWPQARRAGSGEIHAHATIFGDTDGLQICATLGFHEACGGRRSQTRGTKASGSTHERTNSLLLVNGQQEL